MRRRKPDPVHKRISALEQLCYEQGCELALLRAHSADLARKLVAADRRATDGDRAAQALRRLIFDPPPDERRTLRHAS